MNIETIPFNVEGKHYEIPLEHIRAFPIQTALVNVLTEKYMARDKDSIGLDLSDKGEIIIKVPGDEAELIFLDNMNNYGEFSVVFNNFGLVVKIYANPAVTLYDLLELEKVVDLANKCLDANNPASDDFTIWQAWQRELEKAKPYNMIRKTNYQNLLREFDYYGVLALFKSKLAQTEEIDTASMISAFEANLIPLFPVEEKGRSPEERAGCFIHEILAMGGMFSGSSVLRAVLGENWGKNNPRDVDVYVNEGMLEYMTGCKFPPLAKMKEQRRDFLKETLKKREKLGMPNWPSDILDILEEYDMTQQQSLHRRQLVVEEVKKRLGAISVEILATDKNLSYNYNDNIIYVLKIKMAAFEIDMVVVDCTIPYMISRNFDFEFCQVYFDGHTIHSHNWPAAMDKISEIRDERDLPYWTNIDRIAKYLKRGFIITSENTLDYMRLAGEDGDINKVPDITAVNRKP